MTGYGSSLYDADWYAASPYVSKTELPIGIRARIIKPVSSIPPVIDTIAYGLAQRFDWLQQGIQSFALFNKIEYAKGESNGLVASLDDVWGKIYDLPRLTDESDDDYRARLQTYVKVLNGSGTVPNCEEVLDFLVGQDGATTITSMWPARVLIDFNNVAAMRLARSKEALLDSILPGMFAAGIDYELVIPLLDIGIRAAILGDADLPCAIHAAIATESELSWGVDALVSYGRALPLYVRAGIAVEFDLVARQRAAVLADRSLEPALRAAILGEPDLLIGIYAAIRGEPGLYCGQYAAVQTDNALSYYCYAAIARNFDARCRMLARVVCMYELSFSAKAAIRSQRELVTGIRARVARRYA